MTDRELLEKIHAIEQKALISREQGHPHVWPEDYPSLLKDAEARGIVGSAAPPAV
jgi:hypothetical protein